MKTPIILAAAATVSLIALSLALRARADDDPTKIRDYYAPTRHELAHTAGRNDAVIGIVEKMAGPCFVVRGGHGGKTSIQIGLRAQEGDALYTEDLSRLHVRYKDGTYVEMGASTAFQVERVRFKPPNLLPTNTPEDQLDESYFHFDHGVVRITAPDIHALERFSIRTASGVVRVTGPSDFYLIQLEGDRDLTVRVARGKVEVMNMITNETMQVPEKSGAYLKISGVVTGAGTFTDEQLTFLKSRTHI